MKLTSFGLVALAMTSGSGGHASEFIVVKDGVVESYYGVPKSLKLTDVGALPFRHKEGVKLGLEGLTSRTTTITAFNNVEVTVLFDRRGEFLEANTKSRRALDPRGVRVGDKLVRAQKVWPEGKLYYGHLIEGGRPYAIFMTGTNVILGLTDNIQDMEQAPSNVHVKEIRIVGYSTAISTRKKALEQKLR
jgi:hypothetical protein